MAMKRSAVFLTISVVLAISVVPGGHGACAGEARPGYVSIDKLATLRRLGIDPDSDIEMRGNYHWRWRSPESFTIGAYSCPAGSVVAFSRTIDLILPLSKAPCIGQQGVRIKALRLLPDGSAVPLEGCAD